MSKKVDAKAMLREALEEEAREILTEIEILKDSLQKVRDKINLLDTRI